MMQSSFLLLLLSSLGLSTSVITRKPAVISSVPPPTHISWKSHITFENVPPPPTTGSSAVTLAESSIYPRKTPIIFLPDYASIRTADESDALVATLTPTFDVWRLTVDDFDRSSFLQLAEEVSRFILATNQPVTLMGDGFGATLAAYVSQRKSAPTKPPIGLLGTVTRGTGSVEHLILLNPIVSIDSVPSQPLNQLIVQGISNTLDAVSKVIRNEERTTTIQRTQPDDSTPTNQRVDKSFSRPDTSFSPPPSTISQPSDPNQLNPTMTVQSFDMDIDTNPNNNNNNNNDKPSQPSLSRSQPPPQRQHQRPRMHKNDFFARNLRALQQQRVKRERYDSVSQHRYHHWVAVGVPLMETKWANVITPTLVLSLLPEPPQRPFLSSFPNPTFGLLPPSASTNPRSNPSPPFPFPYTRPRNMVQTDQKRVDSLRVDARSLMNKMKSCDDYELKDIPTKWMNSIPTLTMTRMMSSNFTPTSTSENNNRQRQQQQQQQQRQSDQLGEEEPPSPSPSADDLSNVLRPVVQPLSLISSTGQRIRLHREILGAQVFKEDPLDVLYPDEEDLAFASERLKPVKESLSPIFLTRTKDGSIIRGIDTLPTGHDGRPVLFVGNHQYLGLIDVVVLINELLQTKQVLMRGLAHPMMFDTGNPEGSDRLPGSEMIETLSKQFGAVEVSPRSYFDLLQRNETMLLFPGGSREALHLKGEDYKLFWPERTDFVRMAATVPRGCLIVPFAAVGLIENFLVVLDSQEMINLPLGIGDRIYLNSQKLPLARGGVTERLVTPLAFPNPFPERLYFIFQPPIDTKGLDMYDKAQCKLVYESVKGRVNDGLQYLQAFRNNDPYRYYLPRKLYENISGKSPAPTAPLNTNF